MKEAAPTCLGKGILGRRNSQCKALGKSWPWCINGTLGSSSLMEGRILNCPWVSVLTVTGQARQWLRREVAIQEKQGVTACPLRSFPTPVQTCVGDRRWRTQNREGDQGPEKNLCYSHSCRGLAWLKECWVWPWNSVKGPLGHLSELRLMLYFKDHPREFSLS